MRTEPGAPSASLYFRDYYLEWHSFVDRNVEKLKLEWATRRTASEGRLYKDKESGKFFYFIAACAGVTDELKTRLAGAPLVFFDGTVWRDDELIAAGLGNKTGQAMGHIAMSGDRGAIAALDGLDIGQKVFLHINNSNPALLDGSDQRKIAERAGWRIAADGMEIVL